MLKIFLFMALFVAAHAGGYPGRIIQESIDEGLIDEDEVRPHYKRPLEQSHVVVQYNDDSDLDLAVEDEPSKFYEQKYVDTHPKYSSDSGKKKPDCDDENHKGLKTSHELKHKKQSYENVKIHQEEIEVKSHNYGDRVPVEQTKSAYKSGSRLPTRGIYREKKLGSNDYSGNIGQVNADKYPVQKEYTETDIRPQSPKTKSVKAKNAPETQQKQLTYESGLKQGHYGNQGGYTGYSDYKPVLERKPKTPAYPVPSKKHQQKNTLSHYHGSNGNAGISSNQGSGLQLYKESQKKSHSPLHHSSLDSQYSLSGHKLESGNQGASQSSYSGGNAYNQAAIGGKNHYNHGHKSTGSGHEYGSSKHHNSGYKTNFGSGAQQATGYQGSSHNTLGGIDSNENKYLSNAHNKATGSGHEYGASKNHNSGYNNNLNFGSQQTSGYHGSSQNTLGGSGYGYDGIGGNQNHHSLSLGVAGHRNENLHQSQGSGYASGNSHNYGSNHGSGYKQGSNLHSSGLSGSGYNKNLDHNYGQNSASTLNQYGNSNNNHHGYSHLGGSTHYGSGHDRGHYQSNGGGHLTSYQGINGKTIQNSYGIGGSSGFGQTYKKPSTEASHHYQSAGQTSTIKGGTNYQDKNKNSGASGISSASHVSSTKKDYNSHGSSSYLTPSTYITKTSPSQGYYNPTIKSNGIKHPSGTYQAPKPITSSIGQNKHYGHEDTSGILSTEKKNVGPLVSGGYSHPQGNGNSYNSYPKHNLGGYQSPQSSHYQNRQQHDSPIGKHPTIHQTKSPVSHGINSGIKGGPKSPLSNTASYPSVGNSHSVPHSHHEKPEHPLLTKQDANKHYGSGSSGIKGGSKPSEALSYADQKSPSKYLPITSVHSGSHSSGSTYPKPQDSYHPERKDEPGKLEQKELSYEAVLSGQGTPSEGHASSGYGFPSSGSSSTSSSGSYGSDDKYEMSKPMPYEFKYEVKDDEHGANQYREEKMDDNGYLTGRYGYMDPHGLYRQVEYEASKDGFKVSSIKTNEPGTDNADPADVHFEVEKHNQPVY